MKTVFAGSLCVAASMAVWAATAPPPLHSERELAAYMPENTAVYIEAPGLSALMTRGLDDPLVAKLLSSELGRIFAAEAKQTPEAALEELEGLLGRAPLPAAAALTDGGIALGVGVKRSKAVFALAARGRNGAEMRVILEDALGAVADKFGLQRRKVVEPHGNVRGVDTWYLGDDLTLAHQGRLLFASNDEGRVRDMIDLALAEESAGLARKASFASAHVDASTSELAWSWIDLAGLESIKADPIVELRKAAGSAPAQFLLGPEIACVANAKSMRIALTLDAAHIALAVKSFGVDAGAAAAVRAPVSGVRGAIPALPAVVAGEGARAFVYRDLAGLFRARTEIFPAENLPGFAEAISGLALFFGGADVTDEILPGISPWLGLIVREVEFDDGARPDVPLPAAALVARLDNPAELGDRILVAFHTLIGILNIEGAQKMQPQLIPHIELHEGIEVVSANYRRPPEGEGVDLRYNLAPACALVGDTFVIGTHREIVKEVAGQLQRHELETATFPGETLTISGSRAAAVLRDNQDALVMNAVLNEGKSMEEARGDIGGLSLLVDLIERLSLSTQRPVEDALELALRLDLTDFGE